MIIENVEERALVTIDKVLSLEPIVFTNKETGEQETAANIVLATIRGWNVVVGKDEFKIGDYCVFFEIDSIIPPASWNKSLQKEGKEDQPIRLKSKKCLGVLSQGFALPITSVFDNTSEFEVDQNVTELLGVTKYEAPTSFFTSGIPKGNFPDFFPKTNQCRIQNIAKILEKDIEYEISEKQDGSSFSCYLNDGEFGVCSRNFDLKENDDNTFWQLAKKYEIENKLKVLGFDYIALQGEVCGGKIQGNPYKLPEADLFIFDVFDIKTGKYYPPKERLELCEKLGLKHVPIIEIGVKAHKTLKEVLEFAEGKSKLYPVEREGLVYKAMDGSTSWKAISNKFLLKEK